MTNSNIYFCIYQYEKTLALKKNICYTFRKSTEGRNMINNYTIIGSGFEPTIEEIEKLAKNSLSDGVGELVDVRLKKINNFELIKNLDGSWVMMPYKKSFDSEIDLINYMRRYHIGNDGHITYSGRYLREVTDTYLAISTRSGGDIGAITIALDAIEAVFFIGTGTLINE